MSEPPKQQWIGTGQDDPPAPMLRRSFVVDDCVEQAILLLCGLGYHEGWINGRRVSDHVLDPAQSDYQQRVFYVRHDVTSLLRPGANVLGVILGNGWFKQDRVWGSESRPGLSYGDKRLLAELRLTTALMQTRCVRADTEWRWHPGPILVNNIYAGEAYDARLEVPGWAEPGLDDSAWLPAVIVTPPGGELVEQALPPIRCTEEIRPVAIERKPRGGYVVDMGQNFSGWARIGVNAPSGTAITMRFAETIRRPDGEIDTASTGTFATGVEQVDRYVCRGGAAETWEPRFTYHGFRFVEVEGWPGDLTPEQVTGVVVHTDLPRSGDFECSDPRLNQMHQMALWTHRSNVHGLPEDCPARERCGWLGDANLVAEYSLWNFNSMSFWEKYLGDIETTRRGNNGIPSDVAPGLRCTSGEGHPDWVAAFVLLPWYLYLQSGDPAAAVRHWAGMERVMAYMKEQSQGWIVQRGYGDFFDPGAENIVTHTPVPLTSTMWFFRCAQVMKRMAARLGKEEARCRYAEWTEEIGLAIRAAFHDEREGSFGSQTANVLALAFGLIPEDEERILSALVSDIQRRGMHLNVGVMGVRFLFEVLTRHGRGDLAMALMHQDGYPSFGHLIERGATTLWECWGEPGHDETHGARSLNHPFMGGYDNWFFNTLAGIRFDEKAPGFSHLILEPHPVPGLEWVRCHHTCRYGRIESNWSVNRGEFVWEVLLPRGVAATVIFPDGENREEEGEGRYRWVSPLNAEFTEPSC